MKKQAESGGGHDKLVDLNANQTNPYNAKAEEFPVSGSVLGPVGMEEGKNKLVECGGNLGSPRHAEDGGSGSSGAGTPAVWGGLGRNFSVMTNKEVRDSGKPSLAMNVDLVTGKITGGKTDAVDSVFESGVTQN